MFLLLWMVVLTTMAASATATPTKDNQPAEPYKIADNLYYVGASDISSFLITTPAGDILIDAGYDDTVPIVRANLEKLGVKLTDVKILLNTQAHFDHAGGFAQMKELTGATLLASGPDAALIERGGRDDYLFGDRYRYPPARVDMRIKDGERVTLGNVTLTAHVTPGHTPGCTTWTFETTDRGRRYGVVVVGGASINPGTKVSGMAGYPQIGRDYAHTFEVLKSLPCDIFLGAHPSYFGGAEKAEKLRQNPGGPNPFVDPEGYKRFVERSDRTFREQLAKEMKELL